MSILPLMPHQLQTVDYILKNKYVITALEMGTGKAQPLDAEVQTPEGPVPIGRVLLGQKVFGADGKPKTVLGIFPQGIKKVFKVTFNDGSSCECCEDHLWSVRDPNEVYREKPYRVIPLKELNKKYKRDNGNSIWSIPQCSPVEYPETFPAIDPYVMGVLIGDGSLNNGAFNISNCSEEIFENIKNIYPETYRVQSLNIIPCIRGPKNRNILRDTFKRNFVSSLSKEKRIPKEYLRAKVEDRISLLRGLMDTDGYISKYGHSTYSTSSIGLAKDVEELVKSLGGISRVKYKKAKCQTGVFDSWIVLVSLPNDIDYVSKKYKLERKSKKSKYPPRRYISSIEYSRESECVCISVEGEHYLTDDFIVTHNTICSLEAAFQVRAAKILIVCPSYLKINWKREVDKFFPGKTVTIFNKSKEIYPVWDTDVAIVSYSMLEHSECLFEWANFVIADEAHYLKSTKSKRTDLFHKYIYENSTNYLALLTGTPIKNRVEEFYSLLALTYYKPNSETRFLDRFPGPVEFADRYSFRREFSINKGYREVKIVRWEGIRNTEELKGWLKNKYIRFLAREVLSLKEPIFRDVFISDKEDPELMKVFLQYEEKEMAGVQPQFKANAALDKAKYTASYVEDLLDQGLGPIVIFSDHVAPVELLAKHFKIEPITGATPTEKRMKLADKFQSGEIEVLVATIESFSTGVNLTRSNHLVFNDFSWIPGSIDQAIRRILRIGQNKECYVHNIFGSPQDSYIWDTLLEKRKVIEEATDVSKSS